MRSFWLAWEHVASVPECGHGSAPCQLPIDIDDKRLNLQTEQEHSLAPVLRGESQTAPFTQ